MGGKSKIWVVIGTAYAFVWFILDFPGRFQTAQDIVGGRVTWAMPFVHWLLSPWGGALVAIAALIKYSWVQHREDEYISQLEELNELKRKNVVYRNSNDAMSLETIELRAVLDRSKQNQGGENRCRRLGGKAVANENSKEQSAPFRHEEEQKDLKDLVH